MIKTFTKDDLVKFVYNELNEDERQDLKASLAFDTDLQSHLEEIEDGKALLENFTLKAPKNVVSRILYASKNLESA